MKYKAQSLMEFAVILLSVTIVAVIALQIISNKINSGVYQEDTENQQTEQKGVSTEEANCIKMNLYWDKKNGVCEAR